MKTKKLRKHWYMQYIHECPLCGGSRTFKERRFGRKPRRERCYDFTQIWCGCSY